MKLSKLQRKTAEQALIWAEKNLHPTKPRAWSCRKIEKQFGKRKVGQWLRACLLTTTKSNWSIEHHECKEYCLNLQGVEEVRLALGITKEFIQDKIVQEISNKYHNELESGKFIQTYSSNRFHHGLQNVRRETRTRVLVDHGYQYDYDLVCAAPSLLYQRALSTGMQPLKFIPQFIELRSEIRQYLADKHQIDIQQIKQIIIGLFQGGYISKWSHSKSYKTLKGNYNQIERLRADPIIQALSLDIKQMWNHIISDMRQKNQFNEKRVKGKHKTEIYRSIEEEVMREVRRYLTKKKIKYFDIHDGFQTTEVIDEIELEIYVRDKTRYQIDLEKTNLAPY